jgi:drug/metabolite transporter (DMT)-like permease
MNASPRRALAALAAGAAVISWTSIFVRLAHVAPTVSAFWRMAFGGVMLALILLVQRRWEKPTLRDFGWMLLPASAFALDLYLWHRSIAYIGPGLATLIGNFQVFVMALAGWLFYRERIGLRFLVGLALAFAGLWLLVGRGWDAFDPQYRLGVWFGILTGIAYALYMLTFRHAQKEKLTLGPMQLMCLNSLLCALLLGVVVAGEGASFAIPDAQSFWALVALALSGQVLGGLLIVWAMPQLPASVVGMMLLLQPGLSFVLDVVIFSRPTTTIDWIGLAVSLAGIFLATAIQKKPGTDNR